MCNHCVRFSPQNITGRLTQQPLYTDGCALQGRPATSDQREPAAAASHLLAGRPGAARRKAAELSLLTRTSRRQSKNRTDQIHKELRVLKSNENMKCILMNSDSILIAGSSIQLKLLTVIFFWLIYIDSVCMCQKKIYVFRRNLYKIDLKIDKF